MNRKRRVPINNYFAAETRLGKRESRKIDNNTHLHKIHGGAIAIRLHNTDIAIYYPPEHPYAHKIALSNGGWLTSTTKKRLNEWTPARISQKAFVWSESGKEFENGMLIDEQ